MTEYLESCRGQRIGAWDKVFAAPETPEQFPRDRAFQLQHLRLNITVDDEAKSVSGTAIHRLAPINDGLKDVTLDAAELNIRRVTDETGRALAWEVHGETLTIHLPRARKAGEVFELRIRYDAKPRKGLFFVAPDSAYPDKPQVIWSQGEEMDNRNWYPSYDYPNQRFTSEMRVTVRSKYVTLSNGRLVAQKEDKRRGLRTDHWVMDKPHANYLIALVVGEFDKKEWAVDGVPVQAYVPRGKGAFIDRCFKNVPDMVRFFGRMTGLKYPWDKYAQVCVPDYTFGGMENTTLTVLHEYCLTDEKAYWDYNPDGLLSHELAHQWFGDWLTTKSWGHLWLNESFATYAEVLWWEAKYGRDDALMWHEKDREVYFEEAEKHYVRPIVTHKFVEATDMLDAHTYQKGSSVLHMMRHVLGDDLWWKALRHYVKKHSLTNVETNDFKIAIEEATGRNLDWFFDEWLYKPGHPEFDVSWSWDDRTKHVEVRVRQTQETKDGVPVFKMPVEIELLWADRAVRETVQIEKAEHTFRIAAPRRPEAVLFDPDDVLLKKLTFKKEKQELLWQLAHAKAVWPRIEACQGLGTFVGDEQVVTALKRALVRDRYWGVRRAAAAALGEHGTPSARDALLEGVKDKDSRVRRGVYRALGKFRKDEVAFRALVKAYMEDGWYYPMATAAEALAETRHDQAFDAIVKGMDRPSQAEIIGRSACSAIASLRDERGIDVLWERTSYGRPELLRMAAAVSLGKLGYFLEKHRDEILEHLTALLRDVNYRAKLGAADGLGELGYKKALAELEKVAETDILGTVRSRARSAIKKIKEKHAEGAKRLEQQEELDKLRDEGKELKSRLAALEAKVEALSKRKR